MSNASVSASAIPATYKWGMWSLRIHIGLMLLLLINAALHYYQADILDNWLQGRNVAATADELFGMRFIILAFGLLQLVVMLVLHFWMWRYAKRLLDEQQAAPSAKQQWIVLLQPVYGLLKWYRTIEIRAAALEKRHQRSPSFLHWLWAGVMTAVVAYLVVFYLWWAQTNPVLEKSEVAGQVYYHFALAVVNFYFLGVAVYGWRAIQKLQQKWIIHQSGVERNA